jgi:PAS domain S-box-containing protein
MVQILITLLGNGVRSFTLINISRDSLRQEALNANLSQAHLAADFASTYMDAVQAHMKVFASRTDIRQAVFDNTLAQLQPALVQFVQTQTALDSSGIYDSNGIQGAISTLNATTVGQSFADRDWFQQALATRQPYLGAPIMSRVTGNPIIPYSVPILDEQGQMRGVLAGAISVSKLSDAIVNIGYTMDTRASITDLRNGGVIIAHTDPARVMTPASGKNAAVSRLLAGESGAMETASSSGEMDLVGFTTVPDLPWGIMVLTPSAAALATANTLARNAILTTSVIIITAIVVGILMTLGITRPLRRLVVGTQQIGNGNLDYKLAPPSRDELGDLSRAIANMAQNLKQTLVSRDELKDEVIQRKKAEEDLKQSYHLNQRLLDSTPNLIYVYDLSEHRNVYANREIVDFLGYTTEQVQAMGSSLFANILHPDDAEAVTRHHTRFATASDTDVFEIFYRMKHSSGQWRWLRSLDIAFKRNDQGIVTQILGTTEDITGRKQAEDSLKKSEWLLKEAQALGKIGSWDFDPLTGKIEWSDEVYALYERDKALGPPTAEEEAAYYTPEDVIRTREFSRQAIAEGTEFSYEISAIMPSGKTRHLYATMRPVKHSEGRLVKLFGTVQDITGRKQAEEALRQSEELLSLFVKRSPIYAFIKEVSPTESRVLMASDNYQDMIGIPSSQMIGRSMQELFPAEFAANMAAADWAVVSFGKVIELDEELNGRYYNTIKFPITMGGKNLLAGYTIDITERKQAEAENQQLRDKAEISSRLAAIGEMAAGIAHEINNPLTGVIGFSELLLENPNLPPDIRDQIRIIAEGGNRVRNIVKRMLTFARQTKPMRTSGSINELIEASLGLRSYVLRTANIEVVKHLAPDLPWVVVDPGQMQQVFLNLIVNAEFAMKKAHQKGTLTITTENKDGHIRISFKDDGTGMSQETKNKLFHPFFTTKDVGEGTGLGLSLSRSIILEHGGTIEVESQPGQGATFIITLPVTQPAEAAPAEVVTAVSVEKIKTGRILVVDDEETIRSLVRTILSKSGHTVDTTGDAREALTKLENNTYDAVLMDIRMPGMSGMELYAKVIEQHPEMKNRFIFITGDTSDAQTRVFLESNNLPFITKPFDKETLEQRVNAQLLAGSPKAQPGLDSGA